MTRTPIALLAALVCLAGAVPVRAQGVYARVAPATVLFLFDDGWGSGVLVDADKRLVVTAEHVVRQAIREGELEVHAMFPARSKSGKVNTSGAFYKKRKQALQIRGKIVYFDRAKDLAVVKLEKVPPGLKPVPLAKDDPSPGDRVHVVGNSTFGDGGAFGYCTGTIRNQYYYDRPTVVIAGMAAKDKVFFSISHHAPTNRGDSGGPVVNGAGELLGIVSQGTTGKQDQQVIDHSVHVREIRRALEGIQQPAGNSLVVTASVDSVGFDGFLVPVKKGAKIRAELKGKGTSDLDLFLKDVDSFRKARFGERTYRDFAAPVQETGMKDSEAGEFEPDWTGACLVQVQNVQQKKNEYTLKVDWKDRVPAPFTIMRRLASGGTDTITLRYEAGKGKARVTIRGDGDTDLKVEVRDPQGIVLARGEQGTDYHELTWEPPASGAYVVRILNPGGIWNGYVFTTD